MKFWNTVLVSRWVLLCDDNQHKTKADVISLSSLVRLQLEAFEIKNNLTSLQRWNVTCGMTSRYKKSCRSLAHIRCSTKRDYQWHDGYELHDILVRFTLCSIGISLPNYDLIECSSKHNRGVTEVFYEAARVSLGTKAKSSGGDACLLMWPYSLFSSLLYGPWASVVDTR